MEKFSKKTLLNYVNGAGLFGASAGQVVSFKFADTIAKAITAAATSSNGSLIFAIDSATGAGAIWQDNHLVSSKVIDYSIADSASKDHSQKTVTLKYIGAEGVETKTFDLIDEAGLKAYFTNSETITLDASNNYEVKIKADGGLAVDNAGLYVDVADLFGVDEETIGFDEQNKLKTLVKLAYAQSGLGGEPAIQLQNANDEALSEVTVAALIADGIVQSTSYDPATNILTINWKGGAVTTINMAAIIDINDVFIATDSSNLLTATNDTSVVKIGTTAKMRNAVALAESAIQGIEEGASTENYVSLDVAAGNNPSTYAISIDDSALNTKIAALDAKDAEIDSSIDALQAKDEEIDGSLGRLNTSVNALKDAIEALDATESDNVLDGSIAITVTQANGLVTGVDLEATKATVTFDNTGTTPSLTSGSGLLAGDAIAPIKDYVDAVAQKGFDGLDSEVEKKDASNFIGYKVGIVDGKLLDASCSLTAVFGDYAASQTDGLATTGATKTYVDTEIQSLDLANDVTDASAVDAAGFVKTTISETDGIVKNESVEVTYGNYNTHTNGIAKTTDTSVFVEQQITAALTWEILN